MSLDEWAAQWHVSPAALADLRRRMTEAPDPVPPVTGTSEAAVQAHVRLQASRLGYGAWRNNVGALLDSRGVPVRYGLANDSAQMNERFKSADIIGIRPVTVRPEHVGHVIGQFWSRECKTVGWKFHPNDAHEQAQKAWADRVLALGGDAGFTTGEL